MVEKLNLKNPTDYHSHSLRRTGATLLAMAGRTEEQIKTMGNWSSASAVIRYIENPEVSMRNNAKALAHPEFILPKFDQCSAEPAETSSAQKSASPIVTEPEEPEALVSSADSGEKSLDFKAPHALQNVKQIARMFILLRRKCNVAELCSVVQ